MRKCVDGFVLGDIGVCCVEGKRGEEREGAERGACGGDWGKGLEGGGGDGLIISSTSELENIEFLLTNL